MRSQSEAGIEGCVIGVEGSYGGCRGLLELEVVQEGEKDM